ncbi:MAG: TonB-dependent receptor [Bacteroidota bacterium]
MKIVLAYLLFIASFFHLSLAAQFSASGQLTDETDSPLPFANAILHQAADSSFVTGSTTDENGNFTIRTSESGRFYLRATALGYDDLLSEYFKLGPESQQLKIGVLQLQPAGLDLQTVEVSAQKPLFVRQIDRLVVNLENRPTVAGSSALEVVERLPGLLVNRQNGSIEILGKSGVQVMINGRLQYISQDGLLSLLQGISADDIISIEIITTPPAELDAQGNAGYLNLVLKKLPGDGLKGNYNLSAGYGRGSALAGGFGLDWRRGKFALFANLNTTYNNQLQQFDYTRTAPEEMVTSDFFREPRTLTYNGRLGLDFRSGEQTTLGLLFTAYGRDWNMLAVNRLDIEPDTTISADVDEENLWQSLQANFNIQRRFGSGGAISLDLDFLTFDNRNPIDYFYDFDYAGETGERDFLLRTTKETPFNIWVGKVDWNIPLGSSKLSTGLKGVVSVFENEANVLRNGVLQPEFSDLSDLEEYVYAAYAQLDHSFSERIALKVGLRYEYTDTQLDTEAEGRVVDREFGSLFPTLYLKIGDLGASYGRRIDRPAFSDMAPFQIFLDPRTNFAGNTRLQPAISNNVELNYQLGTLNLSAQYSDIDSSLAGFQSRYNPATQRQIIAPENLRRQRILNLSLGLPVPLTDKLKGRLFASYTWSEIEAVLDLGVIREQQGFYRLNSNISWEMPNGLATEINGFYQSAGLRGNARIFPNGVLNFGISKTFDNGARLALNLTDALESLVFRTETVVEAQGFFLDQSYDFSNRTIRLSYSHTFGTGQVEAARRRETAEEAQRVN